MKTILTALSLVAAVNFIPTSFVNAQAVFLQVQQLASTKQDTINWSRDSGSYDKTVNRSQNIKITLRNMDTKLGSYTVTWQFLARDVNNPGNMRVYDEGTKALSLKTGEFTSWEADSTAVQAEDEWHVHAIDRSQSGDTLNGYLVLVRADNQLIAVDASDTVLKKGYQNEINKSLLSSKTAGDPNGASSTMLITKAVYGDLPDGGKSDVTMKVLGMVKHGVLSVVASNDSFGDPAEGATKQLKVDYLFRGVSNSKTVSEGETLTIANTGE